MLAKIATSLLTPKHAKLMHLRAMTEDQVIAELTIQPKWEGFQIPYFTISGELRKDEFYRFRFCPESRPSKGWASLGVPEKPRRYAQPPNSGVAAYFSPTLIDYKWEDIARNSSAPILITEGELKAACACSLGVPTIGLGGVNNWRTADLPFDRMIPELESIVWTDRIVIIVFDSNVEHNPHVRAAAAMFSSVLTLRGAVVKFTHPPVVEGDVTPHGVGLDDWLYALPIKEDKAAALGELAAKAPTMDGSAALHRLNVELARVIDAKEYVRIADGRTYTKRELVEESSYGSITYAQDTADGGKKTVCAIKNWLTWPYCRELKGYAYTPGAGRVVDNHYNVWPGWGIEPAVGDPTPFIDMVRGHLLKNAKKDEIIWLLRWLAAPLQKPGLKMMSGVLIWSHSEGVGKTLIGDTMAYIYGNNYGKIGSRELHGKFNGYIAKKQFILGDETGTSDKRAVAEKLKDMITGKVSEVEEKFKNSYLAQDHVNYMFSANYPDAFILEDNARRFFVHQVTATPMPTAKYDQYYDWLEKGGAAYLFNHLLQLDLGDFNPYKAPPATESRQSMIELGYSDLRLWLEGVRKDPCGITGKKTYLFTAAQLADMYKVVVDRHPGLGWIGRELARMNVKQAAHGSHNLRIGNTTARAYILGAPVELEAKYVALPDKGMQAILDAEKADEPSQKFDANETKEVRAERRTKAVEKAERIRAAQARGEVYDILAEKMQAADDAKALVENDAKTAGKTRSRGVN